MISPDDAPDDDAPLLDARRKEVLQEANERLRKRVLGAGRMAAVNGWTMIAFGALTLLTALFSLTGLVVGGALVGFGWNELRGRKLLRNLDVRGLDVLVRNQIALGVSVFLYCAWSAWSAWARPEPSLAELESTLGISPSEIARLTLLVYAAIFVVSAVALAFTARYHSVRRSRLEAYLRETPEWVVEIQRATL